MRAAEILKRTQEECIYKKSEFIDSLIMFKKSIFQYYHSLTNGKHLIFHPLKMIHYYSLLKSEELKNVDEYINKYLNHNEGWYQWYFIPKHNKQHIKVEIYNCVGKHYASAETCGYGFHENRNSDLSFGWACWVKRWKFIGDNNQEVINIKWKENKK